MLNNPWWSLKFDPSLTQIWCFLLFIRWAHDGFKWHLIRFNLSGTRAASKLSLKFLCWCSMFSPRVLTINWNLTPALLDYDQLLFSKELSHYIYKQQNGVFIRDGNVMHLYLNTKSDSQCCGLPWSLISTRYINCIPSILLCESHKNWTCAVRTATSFTLWN